MADENTIQTYHLKLSFSQYEKSYLTDHLTQYVKKIQRHLPKLTLDTDPPFMLSDHRLLQFDSTASSLIPAYDSFLLNVKFWHMFQPSRLLFTAKLSNLNFFQNSYCLLHQAQTDAIPDTLLSLDTETGTHLVPSHLLPHEVKPLLISQLSLNIHLEQLQYSLAPYDNWHQIESTAGHLHFPLTPSVDFSQLPPIQNKHFQPVLPHLPRAVHFPHGRANHHQHYDPYSDIQDLKSRLAKFSQVMHQNRPPPVQTQHQPNLLPSDQVATDQQSNSDQTLSALGAHNVPPLPEELSSLQEALQLIEARQANNSIPTTTPRLATSTRGRSITRAPFLPSDFRDIHFPSQPPLLHRLQPRDTSSHRDRLHPSHSSSLNSNPTGPRVATGNTPAYQTPAQVKDYWRRTGQQDYLDHTHPPGVSQDDLSNSDQSASSQQSSNITYTTVTHSTGTNDTAHIQTAAKTASVTTASTVTNSAMVPPPSLDPNSMQSKQLPQPPMQDKPTVSVQNVVPSKDVLQNIAVHQKNSDQLNKLSDILKKVPTTNSFKDFSSADPTNNDFPVYTLPAYLRPYLNDLLLRINTSTSNLPLQLFPYIKFDSALNRFVTIESSLDLLTLQKLDHLLNKDKTPNFLTAFTDKVTDKVKKKRNQSNDA